MFDVVQLKPAYKNDQNWEPKAEILILITQYIRNRFLYTGKLVPRAFSSLLYFPAKRKERKNDPGYEVNVLDDFHDFLLRL